MHLALKDAMQISRGWRGTSIRVARCLNGSDLGFDAIDPDMPPWRAGKVRPLLRKTFPRAPASDQDRSRRSRDRCR